MSSIPEAEIVLAVDVGTVNTRASLFDVVDGRYRLVATSESNSTAGSPIYDISEGVRLAMDQVSKITGRNFIDETEAIIMPTTGYGAGVDLFAASVSAGPRIRTVLVGLMPGVSLASARRLADSAYLEVVGEISLMDGRQMEEQVQLILSSRPDLILIVGGTDGGASDPLFQMIEVIRLAVGLIPEGNNPRIVYSGNRSLGALVVDRMADRSGVTVTANIRPSLEKEDLSPARLQIADTLFDIRSRKISGYAELKHWTGGALIPTGEAFGRLIRYLSRIYDPDKGVLGVDLGASQTTIAAAFGGNLTLSVNSSLGSGSSVTGLIKYGDLSKVLRWMPIEATEGQLLDYIFNKAIHYASVPTSTEELYFEYALARQLIRQALREARKSWPESKGTRSRVLLPHVEPIVAAGATLARAPRPSFTALVLIDALQPIGVSTLVVDPYSIAPALGSIAGPLPMATVQLLEAEVLVSLGTVISPVGRIRLGRRVLAYHLEYEDGTPSIQGEVSSGQIVVLPLGVGKFGKLSIRSERGLDVGFGSIGRTGALRVSGGMVGVIIDARGRPLVLPKDAERQRELNQRWLWEIGAME
ncbi:MAG: hypothetical protein GTO18_20860 [Anaerolineales bacterium]|nr:hypothetical protein [Anaerolineales bacterium]